MFLPKVERLLIELREITISPTEKLKRLFKEFPDICAKPPKNMSKESQNNFINFFNLGKEVSGNTAQINTEKVIKPKLNRIQLPVGKKPMLGFFSRLKQKK